MATRIESADTARSNGQNVKKKKADLLALDKRRKAAATAARRLESSRKAIEKAEAVLKEAQLAEAEAAAAFEADDTPKTPLTTQKTMRSSQYGTTNTRQRPSEQAVSPSSIASPFASTYKGKGKEKMVDVPKRSVSSGTVGAEVDDELYRLAVGADEEANKAGTGEKDRSGNELYNPDRFSVIEPAKLSGDSDAMSFRSCDQEL